MSESAIGNKTSFVFLGNSGFGGLPHREQQIARELAWRGFEVKFVEPMPSLASEVQSMVQNFFGQPDASCRGSNRSIPAKLTVLTPPHSASYFRSSRTAALDRLLFRRWFRKSFQTHRWAETVLFVTLPYWWGRFVDRQNCPARLVVYDCHDALEVPSRNNHALTMMVESESLLLKEADIVTYSARSMEPSLAAKREKGGLFFLPNAVEPELISQHISISDRPVTKRLCFLGALDSRWIDVDLLVETAKSFPDSLLEIIGSANTKMRKTLAQCTNIHFHGFLDHEKAKSILFSSDALLMPFRQNIITDQVNPLKLYEYCATGKPIVAMRTKELDRYFKYVYLAATHEEFLDTVRVALAEKDLTKSEARMAFARSNTWSRRTDELMEIIGRYLKVD